MCATCKQITNASDAKTFALAGNAHFTLVSKKTAKRYTFKVQKSKKTANDAPIVWFVSTLYGSDNTSAYSYVGMIKDDKFSLTKKSQYNNASPQFLAFDFVWRAMTDAANPRVPETAEFWHEGRCGRCNRLLTVPASIESGIGPECAKYMGM